MARKKRLNTAAVLGVECAAISGIADDSGSSFSTAAYVRLSMEDSGKIDGYSLQNQEDLLLSFINDHKELNLYKMYVDNGFSGTKFQRPAFEEMMQDMKDGRINCIVVKDLSRLGRNYLEAGNYLEQIFPFFKIRFISITDGYDSISPDFTDEALMIPLKNIINEGYAKDISLKVSSSIATRKKQGKFMGKYPPYGYLKDPKDKNHLIVDMETSLIVQRIFQMRSEGTSLGAIAKILNAEQIPCPTRYLLEKGISKESRFAESFWDRNIVRRILKNRVYLGMIVYGKEQTSFAKGIKRHTIPEKDWQVVQGTHEAIIGEELFYRVQDMLAQSKQEFYDKTGINEDYQPENLFHGIVKCADCGRAMKMSKFVRTIKSGEKIYSAVYECSRHKNLYDYSCPQKSIHKQELDRAVEEAIRYHIHLFLDTERVVAELNKKTTVRQAAASNQDMIKKKQRRIAKVEQMSCGIYEDYQEGLLNETEYLSMRKNYAEEVQTLTEEIDNLLKEQKGYDENFHATGTLAELAYRYRDFSALTREIVETFIAEIQVHTDSRLTILFRFEDEFEKLQQLAELRKGA